MRGGVDIRPWFRVFTSDSQRKQNSVEHGALPFEKVRFQINDATF